MIYSYQAVELIPKQLSEGVVYHSEEFQLAALLCACGCGHRVTLLVPDSHQVISEGGLATVHPSIAVCDGACKSHYYITEGKVDFLPAFTSTQSTLLMRRQIARHEARDAKPSSWTSRLRSAVLRAIGATSRVFRRKRER